MFNSGNCMSVPLVANIDGNGGCNNGMNGWGGDWIWIILVFALIWGNNGFGGWGNGNNASGGALTRGELCQDMNFNDLQGGVRSIQTSLADGFRNIDNAVCTLGYNQGQLASGVQMQIANGFGTLDTSLCQVTNNLTQSINGVSSQLAQCCCENRQAIAETNYNLATQACQTRQVINDAVRSLHDEIVANRIEDKNAEIARQNQQIFALQLQASQQEQNNYLVNRLSPCPIPAYPACPSGTYYPQLFGGYGNTGCSGCNC